VKVDDSLNSPLKLLENLIDEGLSIAKEHLGSTPKSLGHEFLCKQAR